MTKSKKSQESNTADPLLRPPSVRILNKPSHRTDFVSNTCRIKIRMCPLGMTFPAIYHIEVPGLRYIEWASLDNFGVSMLGQRRKVDGVIVPEAYVINLSFTSLTIEAANFMTMVKTPGQSMQEFGREKYEALGQLRQIRDQARDAANNQLDAIRGAFGMSPVDRSGGGGF